MWNGKIGCALLRQRQLRWFGMSREGIRKNHLVESWNWKLLEDVLGDHRFSEAKTPFATSLSGTSEKKLEEDCGDRYETVWSL